MTTDMKKLAADALSIARDAAKQAGHPEAEVQVDVVRRATANIRFARNEATTSGAADEVSVTTWVGLGQRHASARTNQSDRESLETVAKRALAMAKLAPVDPEMMPLVGPQTFRAVPSSYDDGLATLRASDRAAIAGRAIAAGDRSKVQIAGFLDEQATEYCMENSAGLSAKHRGTSVDYSVTARTIDHAGSGWGGRQAWRVAELDDEQIVRTAIDKATRSVGATPLPPGKYTVILEPQAVSELLSFMIGRMSQRLVDEGRSFFAGKVGQKLFPDDVTLESDPADSSTPGAPFDYEGLALDRMSWIANGRVNQLSVSRFWAKKKDLKPTGSHRVFRLSGGKAESVDELVRGTKRGLLVTRFWYNRMLEPKSITVTGLTRDGVFLIEDGKITRPVSNFRYNESPINMLKNVDGMTRATTHVIDEDLWQVPALRTNEFTMASASAAV